MQTFLQKNAFLPQNNAQPYEIHVYFAEKEGFFVAGSSSSLQSADGILSNKKRDFACSSKLGQTKIPFFIAEREGFEPPEPFSSPVFKTGVIDHSTIFPKAGAKLLLFFHSTKYFGKKMQ